MTYESMSRDERRLERLRCALLFYSLDRNTWQIIRNTDGKIMDTLSGIGRGQINLKCKSSSITANQFAWYEMTGTDPNELNSRVIFLDGDPTNLHPKNLNRVPGPWLNKAGRNDNNSSEYCGVSFIKKNQKWQAYYAWLGENVNIGSFDSKAEAIVARKAAVQELQEKEFPNFKMTITEEDLK